MNRSEARTYLHTALTERVVRFLDESGDVGSLERSSIRAEISPALDDSLARLNNDSRTELVECVARVKAAFSPSSSNGSRAVRALSRDDIDDFDDFCNRVLDDLARSSSGTARREAYGLA